MSIYKVQVQWVETRRFPTHPDGKLYNGHYHTFEGHQVGDLFYVTNELFGTSKMFESCYNAIQQLVITKQCRLFAAIKM
jgi:hypothetical protein